MYTSLNKYVSDEYAPKMPLGSMPQAFKHRVKIIGASWSHLKAFWSCPEASSRCLEASTSCDFATCNHPNQNFKADNRIKSYYGTLEMSCSHLEEFWRRPEASSKHTHTSSKNMFHKLYALNIACIHLETSEGILEAAWSHLEFFWSCLQTSWTSLEACKSGDFALHVI